MTRPTVRTEAPEFDLAEDVKNILSKHRLSINEYFNITNGEHICTYPDFAAALRGEFSTPQAVQHLAASIPFFNDWLTSPERNKNIADARAALQDAQAYAAAAEAEAHAATRARKLARLALHAARKAVQALEPDENPSRPKLGRPKSRF